MTKPRKKELFNISLECVTDDFEDKGVAAPCVQIRANIYHSKDIVKVISWLNKALLWKIEEEIKKFRRG